jgi:hypothetical protein
MPCPVKADIPLFCQFYCLFSFSLFWVPHLWQEPERKAALPIEPSGENEDAITLLVRMPDSSRHGRRFLKSDKLKYLFDFIDAAGLVKPGTYRVVSPVMCDKYSHALFHCNF